MQKKKQMKTPISHEKILKIMLWVTIAVAGVFFLKNVLTKSMQGAVVIGASLCVFGGILLFMHWKKVAITAKEFVVSLSLLFLIFIISLNSGAYYSDDFPMFLAVIGMSGLYMEPKFARIQIVIADILLIIMYVLHPEKAESLSQYIMCLVIFTLAAFLFYLTIKRGRAFIEISQDRATEAESLVQSIKDMGEELELDFAQSSSQIENNTQELQRGSDSIVQSANDVTNRCNDVQDRIHLSQHSISELNEEVNKFEQALAENRVNVENMSRQLSSVSTTIYEANEVFQAMEKKMSEIASIAEQLNLISFNTTILSLNASIEAARAGETGAGFAVVASEMRELSNNSNLFSEQVAEVVKELMSQVGETAGQFMDSTKALEESEKTMQGLQESFGRLTERFGALYDNIETQNSNVNQVDAIFGDLKARAIEMQNCSTDNQGAVDAIVDAMELYKVNINHVVENTRNIETKEE